MFSAKGICQSLAKKCTHFKSLIALVVASLAVGGFFIANNALAVGGVTITPAIGGSNVSIDTTSAGGTGSYKSLSGPVITENVAGDISKGIHTLSLPVGWEFNIGSTIDINIADGDINLVSTNIIPSATSFSFEVSGASTMPSSLWFSGLKVRPTGTVSGTSGNITHSGAFIAGITDNFGTLKTVAGAVHYLKIEDSAMGGNEIPIQEIISGHSKIVYSIQRDQFNNFINNVAATWSLGNKTYGVADGNLVAAGDNKSATFTGNLVGTATIHAVAGSFSADSGVLTVIPGSVSATNSTIGVSPADNAIVSSGASQITVTVIAKDAAGNLISGKNVVVQATGDQPSNTITPTSPTTDSSGVATFTISSTKAEQKTISATIEGNPIDASQNKIITFTHDVASQLSITQQPSTTATAGVAFAQHPIIHILDQFGNLVTDSSAVVTAAKHSDAYSDVLKGILTATASGGIATFSDLNYEKATSITIDFSSDSLTPVTSGSIAVSPANPATVEFAQQPTSTDTVDSPLSTQPIVSVKDIFGNNILSGSVILSVGSGTGNLRTTLTQTISNGLAAFSDIGYSKSGEPFTITATVDGFPSTNITSASVGPLSAGIIHSFTLSAASPQTAGMSFSILVSDAVDQFGNQTSGTVALSASFDCGSGGGGGGNGGGGGGGCGPLVGGNIIVIEGNGSTNYTLTKAVSTVISGQVGLITANTGSISVNPATPSKIILTSSANSVNANGTDSVTITAQLQDKFSNNNLTDGISIAFTSPRGNIASPILTNGSGQAVATLNSGIDRNSGDVIVTASSASLDSGTKTITFIDVTAPAAPTVSTPSSPVVINASNKTTQTIAGTAEVGSTVKIYVDGIATAITSTATGGSFTFSNSQLVSAGIVSDTDYPVAKPVTLTATDAAHNESAVSITISYTQDTLAPSISSYTLNGSEQNVVFNPNTSASVSIVINASEVISNWTSLQIINSSNTVVKEYHPGVPYDGTNQLTQIWDGKITGGSVATDGEYRVKIHIEDAAGNELNNLILSPFIITVDKIAPTVTISYSTGANPAKAGSEIITATYSEPIVGTPQITVNQQGSAIDTSAMTSTDQKVWTYTYAVNPADGSAYKDGQTTVSLSTVADAAGNNAATPTNNNFTIDTTNPVVAITSPTASQFIQNAGGTITVESSAADDSNVTCQYQVGLLTNSIACTGGTISGLAEHKQTLTITATDTAGNVGSAQVVVIVDRDGTITVGKSGSDSEDFATISEAVNKAVVNDTIQISSGSYAESVLIEKKLALVGVGETKPVINGNASANYILKINNTGANGTVIDNLEINGGTTNAFDYGILVNNSGSNSDSNRVEIKNSTIKNIWNSSANGIGVESSSYVLAYDNAISSFHKRGIRFINSGGKFYSNDVKGDSVDGTTRVQNLVTLWGGSNVEIYGNTLHDAKSLPGTPTWDSPAVFVSSYDSNVASQANIHDNEIYNGDTGIVVGSYYSTTDTSSAVITNNNLHNLNQAINFEKGTITATITHNKFVDVVKAINADDGDNGPVTKPTVDAEQNWWGYITGPATDAVYTGVDYRPWCTNEACDPVDTTSPTVAINALLTNNTTPTITGTVIESNAVTVKVIVNSVEYIAVATDGIWSANVTNVLAEGIYNVTATAEDSAGNIGTDATNNELKIDTTAPTATVGYSTTAITKDDVIATITPSESVTVTNNGGSLSYTLTTNGSFIFEFVDAAGNPGTVTATVVNIDKDAPIAPTISSIAADNFISNAEKTAVVVAGTAEANALINITLTDGVHSVSGSQQLTGGAAEFSVSLDGSTLLDGAITPAVTATDAAGNISEAAATPTAVKDIIIPSVIESSLSPARSAIGIVLDTEIFVGFSEKVVITAGNITLKKGETIVSIASVEFNNTTNTATINPGTLDSNETYTVTLSGITDEAGNPMSDYKPSDPYKFTTATGYSVAMAKGWNLVSLPVTPTTWKSIPNTIAGINTKVDRIWTYDAVAGEWLVYNNTGAPSDGNFTTLEAGHGYWVDMNDAGTLIGSGTLYEQLIPSGGTPSNKLPQVQLAAGWNMIGYYQLPGVTNAPIVNALSKLSGAWDGPDLNGYSNNLITFTPGNLQPTTPISTMKPGEGYWVYMNSSKIYSFGTKPVN